MNLYNLLQRYRKSSVTFKATVWYTVCNMLQKIAAFLIIPFLTRMLSTSDYGLYSVFLSWVDIIEILATMRMYSNGYVAGLVKNSDDQDKYTCSIQFITVLNIIICFGIFFIFSNQVSDLIQIDKNLIYYMFFSFFATASVGIWSSRQRVNNRYKLMVIVTLLYSVLAPVASIIGAYVSVNRLEAVIEVRVLTQFIIAIPFFLMNLLGKNKMIVWRYCKDTLTYNLPLIPYYLSMVLLNSSDRIMIKAIVGETEAGIYSVAYSLSMAVFVFVGALNLSLQPWLFNKLKNSKPDGANEVISFSTCFIAALNICVLILSPELIKIISTDRYIDAIWTMPPIICSLLIIFIYQQFLNIHFYFGENKIVFITSIIAASLNLLLNYIFIRLIGYISAGYTTLISYSVIMLLYFITMKRIAEKNAINYKDYFNVPLILFITLLFACLSVFIMLLYPYPIIRYLIVVVAFLFYFVFHKRIIEFIDRSRLVEGILHK